MKVVDCKDCQGFGGHSAYEEEVQDLVKHTCDTCKGEGVLEIPTIKTVKELDKLAMERYETGGDIFIECWEKEAKQELLDDHPDDAYEFITSLMDNYHDHAQGIRNTAF